MQNGQQMGGAGAPGLPSQQQQIVSQHASSLGTSNKKPHKSKATSKPDVGSEASRNTHNTGQNNSLQSFGATKNSVKNNGTPQKRMNNNSHQYDGVSSHLFGAFKGGKSQPESANSKNYYSSSGQKREARLFKEGSETQTAENPSQFDGSPTFNNPSDIVNTPMQSHKKAPTDFSRKSENFKSKSRISVPSPSSRMTGGSRSKNSKNKGGSSMGDDRGNSANLLRSPALQLEMSKKQQSNPVSTIKKARNDNPVALTIGGVSGYQLNPVDRANETEEESAQFVLRPSAVLDASSQDQQQDQYSQGNQNQAYMIQPSAQQVSGYNSGYSSGPGNTGAVESSQNPSPRVARFKAKAAGIRQQWQKQKKSVKRKSPKQTEYIKVQESHEQLPSNHSDPNVPSENDDDNDQEIGADSRIAEEIDPVNKDSNNQIMMTHPTLSTPELDPNSISDLNPMLSQTNSQRGSHIIPSTNQTLQNQAVQEVQKQVINSTSSINPEKKQLQRKKSFSSNEFQDQLKMAQVRNRKNRISQLVGRSSGDGTPEEQFSNNKSNQFSTTDKNDKNDTEQQKAAGNKTIQSRPSANPNLINMPSPSKSAFGRSPRVQAKRGAQSQANQLPKKKGKQVINRNLAKGQSAIDKRYGSTVVAAHPDDKFMETKIMSVSDEYGNGSEQALAPVGMRPKGKAIDPYVKSDHLQRSQKMLQEEQDVTSEQYQQMIEQFMQDQEAQFEVFETGPDGEFKPIFMVGKCPPPEKELLKQNIISTLSNKSLSRGSTPRGRDQVVNQNQLGDVSLSQQSLGAPKFMPGSISHVSGGIGANALSVIQSESKEETERSTVQNMPAISGIVSKKYLHTQESKDIHGSVVRLADVKSEYSGVISASALGTGPDLDKSIQNIENNVGSRNQEAPSPTSNINKSQYGEQKNLPHLNPSKYDTLLAQKQQQVQQKRTSFKNPLNATTMPKTLQQTQQFQQKQKLKKPRSPNSLSMQNQSLLTKYDMDQEHPLKVKRKTTNTSPRPLSTSKRGVSPRRNQNFASTMVGATQARDPYNQLTKSTVKRIGVDLKSQGRNSGRKAAGSTTRRQALITGRNSMTQESSKSPRKGSLKTKRVGERDQQNLYTQIGNGKYNPLLSTQQQPSRRPLSTSTRTVQDKQRARRNNGKQPKNSEIKTVNFNMDGGNTRSNQINSARRNNNSDLSEKEDNQSQPAYFATVTPEVNRESINSNIQKSQGGRKSFSNQQNQETSKSQNGNQAPLSSDLIDKLLTDYEQNPRLAQANKKDKNFVRSWEKILERFDKKTYQIQNQKDFKALTRSINMIPNFTSEYKATQVYAAHEQFMMKKQGRPAGQALKKFESLRCIFLLFSLSTSVQDLHLYNNSVSGNGAPISEQELAYQAEFRDLSEQLQGMPKGANIYEVDAELAWRMNEARNKFLKVWVKQQIKIGSVGKY